MIGHELAIEQGEAAGFEPRHQPGERDLRGIGAQREHAFPEKGTAERDAVKAADEIAVLPAFHRMGVAEPMKRAVTFLDLGIDPGFLPLGAMADNVTKGAIRGHLKPVLAHRLAQRMGEAERVERNDRPLARLNPIDLIRIPAVRHRKHADRISA